ncbi:MAG TPA: ABC transporter ATP-binding protein [Candidatus Coatesbacteria bacterium]|nr:ABC transporter ATP-binding protein [Candidatus Coatesbacteria bacterium]
MTDAKASTLAVEGLSYRYPEGPTALAGVGLELAAGEHLALLGGNGAGKSTLLLCLAAALVYSGRLEVDGLEARRNKAAVRERVGLVFQDPGDMLFAPTCREEVAYGPLCRGLSEGEIAEEVHRWLHWSGLAEKADVPPFHLSYGERRRLSLAAVLACRPSLLALDEPAAMLDPAAVRDLAELLATLPQTMLLATHDLGFAERAARRAVVLCEGRLVYDGGFDGLRAHPELTDWRLA